MSARKAPLWALACVAPDKSMTVTLVSDERAPLDQDAARLGRAYPESSWIVIPHRGVQS